jgi:hypothetical protein
VAQPLTFFGVMSGLPAWSSDEFDMHCAAMTSLSAAACDGGRGLAAAREY